MPLGTVCLATGLALLAAPSRALWWASASQSRWLDRPITIDGKAEDWKAQEPDEDEGLAFAFANDERDLYILLSPHTKSNREQLAGTYGQDFFIWLDPQGGKGKRLGLKLPAPSMSGAAYRPFELVGLDTAALSAQPGPGAEAKMGPVLERGVCEARVPLRFLGTPAPGRISVRFEASSLAKAPGRKPGQALPRPERGGGRRGEGRRSGSRGDDEEEFAPIGLWVQVRLAQAPRP